LLYDNDTRLDNYINFKKDNYTINLKDSTKNSDLKPIDISSQIVTFNYSDVTHIKISIYDKTHDKLLFHTVKRFNMSNQILVNDTLNNIIDDYGDYSDEFNALDLDNNKLITLKEFKSIGDIEKYNYLKSYSESELKEEYDNLDSNNDNYLTMKDFEVYL